MKLGRIILAHSRSDAALSIPGVAVIYAPLSQDKDTALFYRKQCSIEPGDATAYHDVIVMIHLLHRPLSLQTGTK
jgi:hypothetical protein